MDPDLMPLIVAENYVNSRGAMDMKRLCEASSCIAEGDIINDLASLLSRYNWYIDVNMLGSSSTSLELDAYTSIVFWNLSWSFA